MTVHRGVQRALSFTFVLTLASTVMWQFFSKALVIGHTFAATFPRTLYATTNEQACFLSCRVNNLLESMTWRSGMKWASQQ